jgi:hypothetical protein
MGSAAESSAWDRIERGEGCWLWTGPVDRGGYGICGVPDLRLAHRFVYTRLVGPIPGGLQLDHLCRVPACVNPAHLQPVTNRENARRGLHGVLATSCKHGHPYTESNTRWEPTAFGQARRCRVCTRESVHRYQRRQQASGIR